MFNFCIYLESLKPYDKIPCSCLPALLSFLFFPISLALSLPALSVIHALQSPILHSPLCLSPPLCTLSVYRAHIESSLLVCLPSRHFLSCYFCHSLPGTCAVCQKRQAYPSLLYRKRGRGRERRRIITSPVSQCMHLCPAVTEITMVIYLLEESMLLS